MIIQKQDEQAVLQSDFDSSGFEIDKSDLSIVFSTISEGLYSDPISSMIREIVSNAVDATIEAGKDDPVIVKLGTDLGGPYLSIQDFGVGLSPERIESVYRKLFKSTKRESNDQIGAFGLGRFSIFSYTNTFYLTTIYDGVETTYQLYLNDGVPNMVDLATKQVNLPNGTTVKIYIKKDDIDKVASKIKNTLMYFKNIYVINELTHRVIFDNDYKLVYGSTFVHCTKAEYDELHICLGGVYYPINWSILKPHFSRPIGMNCALLFDNGELTVTRSREEIKYTDETIAKILDKIQSFISEVSVIYNCMEINIFNDLTITNLYQLGSALTYIEINGVRIKVDLQSLQLRRDFYYGDGNIIINTRYSLTALLESIGGNIYPLASTKLGKHKVYNMPSSPGELKQLAYKFSSEPLTKKTIDTLRLNGINKVLVLHKKFDREYSSLIKDMYVGQRSLTNPAKIRVVLQSFIELQFKLKSIYNVKHINEYKQKTIPAIKQLSFRSCEGKSSYFKNVSTIDAIKTNLILRNVAVKNEDYLKFVAPNVLTVKGSKRDVLDAGIKYTTMEELTKKSKMHDLLRLYKLSKVYPELSPRFVKMGLVKSEVLTNLFKYYSETNGLKIPVNDFTDELLEIYEQDHAIDVSENIKLIDSYIKFSNVAKPILSSNLDLYHKLIGIRALAIHFKVAYPYWLANEKVVLSLQKLVKDYNTLGWSERTELEKIGKDLYSVIVEFSSPVIGPISANYNLSPEIIDKVVELASVEGNSILNFIQSQSATEVKQEVPF